MGLPKEVVEKVAGAVEASKEAAEASKEAAETTAEAVEMAEAEEVTSIAEEAEVKTKALVDTTAPAIVCEAVEAEVTEAAGVAEGIVGGRLLEEFHQPSSRKYSAHGLTLIRLTYGIGPIL